MINSEGFVLVKNGEPKASIAVGKKATACERHSAEELASFIGKISGAKPEIISEEEAGKADGLILIGKPETNSLIMREAGDIWADGKHKLDTLYIKVTEKYIILSGNRERSVLYAVYHFLERFLNVGFFWDGDSIHGQRDAVIPQTELTEEAEFEFRFSKSAAECNQEYTFTRHWGFEAWKNEIDYMMKNKMNLVRINLTQDIFMLRAYKRLGLTVGEENESMKKRLAEAKKLYDYCHMVDIDIVGDMPSNVVSQQFKDNFGTPDDYFGDIWSCVPNAEERLKKEPRLHLFLRTEAYRKLAVAYLQEWKAYYGWTDKFFVPMFPSESLLTCTIGDVVEGSMENAIKAVREVVPDGRLSVDGWMFRFMYKDFWENGGVEKFFGGADPNGYIILDLYTPYWCNSAPLYRMKGYDWVANRRFILSIIENFGGDNWLHGSFDELISEAKALITDKTNGCGLGNSAEVMYFCVHYYDLINHLGWNSSRLEKERFVEEQALRRYGSELYGETVEAYKALVDAVYTGYKTVQPQYQIRITFGDCKEQPPKDTTTAEKLRKYLTMMLPLSEKAKQNEFLLADVYEALRQYIAELFDIQLKKLQTACFNMDKNGFKMYSDALLSLLDGLEKLTRSNKRWYVEYEARKLEPMTAINSGKANMENIASIREQIRDAGTTFAKVLPGLIDYSRKDYHELVKYYYIPRFKSSLKFFEERINGGYDRFEAEDKAPLYDEFRKIELAWVENGYPTEEYDAPAKPLADAIEEVFREV